MLGTHSGACLGQGQEPRQGQENKEPGQGQEPRQGPSQELGQPPLVLGALGPG